METKVFAQLGGTRAGYTRPALARTWSGRVSILAGLGLLSACAGSETGNAQLERPEQPVSIALAFAGAEPGGPSSTSADGLVITAEAGTAWVDSLELGLASGEVCSDDLALAEELGAFFHPRCDDGDTLVIEGPWVVDLVTGQFEPPLEGISLPEVALAEVRVKLKGRDESPALEVLGSVGDREFELSVKGSVPAKFSDEAPVLVDDGLGRLILDLGFESWFGELEVVPCVEAPGRPAGPVDLTGPGCGSVEQSVRNQLVRGNLRSLPR